MTLLKQSTDYALRALICLAAHHGRPCTARELATMTRVPPSYLAKLLQRLKAAGVLRSRRGPGGGFVFVTSPDVLTVLDVVRQIDPVPRITSCPLRIPSHRLNLCPLHRALDQALASVEQVLDQATFAELGRELARHQPRPAGLPPAPPTANRPARLSERGSPNASVAAPAGKEARRPER